MFKEAVGPLKEVLVKNKEQNKGDILNCNTSFSYLHLTIIYFQQRFLFIIFYILLTIPGVFIPRFLIDGFISSWNPGRFSSWD